MSGASKQAHPDGGRTWRLGAIANGARKPKSEKMQKDQESDLDNTQSSPKWRKVSKMMAEGEP